MAIVRRSSHRWWVPLVTIAGAMLATADASASEMGGNGARTVACGITGSVSLSRLPVRIDAQDWADRIDEDDDSDLPERLWFRNLVRCLRDLIVHECDSRFPFVNTLSARSRLSQHLRC